MEFQASGAKLKLVPWDGDIFTASSCRWAVRPYSRFGFLTSGFAQFQMDKDGKLNLLRLSLVDGQAYEFRRE